MTFTKDNAKQMGSKGGKAKTLKGIHWLKVNDPKKYQQALENMRKPRRKNEQNI